MSAVACIPANRLGAIPVGWLVKPIGELAVIATGNTPPTADASNYGDDFLFASPADIDDSKWIHQTGKRLSKKGFSVARPFPAKSVLFVCIGSTIGKCAIASVELTSNQQINAVFPSEHLDSEFLYYSLLMAAPSVKEQAGEQAVPLVNKTQFSGTLIAVPKLSEQRAIATALSDVDALIAGLEKLIAKKRDLKQAAMQQLLTGQTRLPGFSGDWHSKMLGDIAHIQKGQLITTETLVAGSIPVIAGGKKPAYFHNKPNRLSKTITVSASGASAGYVAFHRSPIFASDCSTISEAKSYCIEFLYFSLQLQQEAIYSAQTGGAQPHIQPKDLSPLPVLLPIALEEQQTIARVLCDMDDELAALETRLAKTRDLKQGMMQELLTGRIRLV